MTNPIVTVEKTKNEKTGIVSATYAPLTTCPGACPFKKAGCYARNGKVGMVSRRCTETSGNLSQKEIATYEADAILSLSGKNPLRLHVSGDFFNAETAAIIDQAAGKYTARYGQPVWAYTHNWRNIPRSVFKNIAIFASCENRAQEAQARIDGYDVALIVPDQTKPRGVTICRHSTNGTQCIDCKLCFKNKNNRRTIGFWPHGAQRKTVESIVTRANNQY